MNWRTVILMLSLTLILIACGNGDNNDNGQNGDPVATNFVRANESEVRAGKPVSNPPLLTGAGFQDLFDGDAITTDNSGEAEIDLALCTNNVFLFRDNGSMRLSACAQDANICLQNGAVFFTDCAAAFTVETNSALVDVTGTSFGVMYNEPLQLTTVVTMEDSVSVRGVRDLAAGAYYEGQIVTGGHFYYTTPEGVDLTIAGLEPRTPLPLEALVPYVRELRRAYDTNLQPWMEDFEATGDATGTLHPTWPFHNGEPYMPGVGPTLDRSPELPDPALVLALGGGPLDEPSVQRAVLLGADWAVMIEEFFGGTGGLVVARYGSLSLATPQFDPERAVESLWEAGYPEGLQLILFFPDDDDVAATVADWSGGQLSELGLAVEVVPIPRAELNEALLATREEGIAALVITVNASND